MEETFFQDIGYICGQASRIFPTLQRSDRAGIWGKGLVFRLIWWETEEYLTKPLSFHFCLHLSTEGSNDSKGRVNNPCLLFSTQAEFGKGSGEVGESVKQLLCQHEDLSSDPSSHLKSSGLCL